MTVVAGIAAGDVRWVLTNCSKAIVARAARAEDLGVVNGHHWRKYISRMAVFADVGCIYMPHILAGRLGAIVTAYAITHDVQVIEIRGQPAKCAVTVIAGFATGDMPLIFAGCSSAVVAGAACADDLGVIDDHCRCEFVR